MSWPSTSLRGINSKVEQFSPVTAGIKEAVFSRWYRPFGSDPVNPRGESFDFQFDGILRLCARRASKKIGLANDQFALIFPIGIPRHALDGTKRVSVSSCA